MATKERHYLTLEKKVELIKFFQKNPGTSVRSLGEQFGCGRTQVGKILKSRESLSRGGHSHRCNSHGYDRGHDL